MSLILLVLGFVLFVLAGLILAASAAVGIAPLALIAFGLACTTLAAIVP